MAERRVQRAPERARRWRPGEAVVWRCHGCTAVLGLVAGDTLHVEHEQRVIEVEGGRTFRQRCHQCGALNVQTPPLDGRDPMP